jgi:hypothetical protein
VTDYRRFLASASPAEQRVLPYFGGPFVEAADRRLRVAGQPPPAPGFWRFEVRGRTAEALAAADPPDLSARPAVRGYALRGYVVDTDGRAERLAIGPADEPPRFAPLVARRWPTGELVFDTIDFETGVEDRVREVYDGGRTLRGEPGIPAALRAAFGYAVLLRSADERGIPARPVEARASVVELADQGEPAARRLLLRLAAARQHGSGRTGIVPAVRSRQRAVDDPIDRAAEALRAAGAVLHEARRLDVGLLEVRYGFLGEQFVSIVHGTSLQVVDAGICLSGEDRALTLESLPSVLREAIQTDSLHMTAW